MKFRPILFSTEMVKAILEGGKTQTRRIVKPQPCRDEITNGKRYLCQPGWPLLCESEFIDRMCPRGKVGDVLWVREEHYRYGQWKKNGLTKTGRERWRFYPDSQFKEIRYFDNPPATIEKNSHRSTGWYKRLARFMPKSACRVFLKIEDIRVERLQDISEGDAIAEGIKPNGEQANGEWFHYTRGFDDFPAFSPRESYFSLWEKINGKESLDANPWVWAISFTRIDKPENF